MKIRLAEAHSALAGQSVHQRATGFVNHAVDKTQRAGNHQRALIDGALRGVSLNKVVVHHDNFIG